MTFFERKSGRDIITPAFFFFVYKDETTSKQLLS